MKAILTLALILTAFNTGLVWLVQLVHYPGFAQVGKDAYRVYQEFHMRTISYIVAPSMLLELFLSLGLLFYLKDIGATWIYYLSLALLAVIWLNTAFWAIPAHNQLLHNGLDTDLIAKLVNINWWRTVCWSIRTLVLGYLVYKVLCQ